MGSVDGDAAAEPPRAAATTTYAGRPWLAHYRVPATGRSGPEGVTAVEMFRATVLRRPDQDALRYFGTGITWAELDALTDALAVGLLDAGFAAGERAALYLQNIPQFVIAQVAVWKAGGITVSVNPMYRERELAEVLGDSGATVLVCLQSLYRDVAAAVVPGTAVHTVVTTSELDLAGDADPRVFAGIERIETPGTTDLLDLCGRHRGATPPPVPTRPGDLAFLTYTSGTTGPPKGAMTTHASLVFNARTYRDWIGVDGDDVLLGAAPLFHITGLVGHVALAVLTGAPLVLMYRLDPALTLEVVRREKATFTVGSITVFIALMNAAGRASTDLATLSKIYSGGAPIPPAVVEAFRTRFGQYVHNIYGLTETTSPTHCVPFGTDAPLDAGTGALAVGVPVFDTDARIVDDAGEELPVGEVGEIAVRGRQVMAGYWNRPEETADALRGGEFRTGDVGYMDADGWFYVVDRKKDQINAGGFKVWPREVEDVLYGHDAVREVAVVGVHDPYRGETVKAVVALRPGATATPDELVGYCRSRMAAYKYPRIIEFVAELPKTASGKILRRELRAPASTT
jgi:long-chain acyl-CoA synthetase